jgi:hypothetical protein
MSAADIAELLDDAAAARKLAAMVQGTDASSDLIAYASALEAFAAEGKSVPTHANWLPEDRRNLKAG